MRRLIKFLLLQRSAPFFAYFFFFNDTATTEIYTLSLHDALPISALGLPSRGWPTLPTLMKYFRRSEEHTSELQSPTNLVCRLLLEKKKKPTNGRERRGQRQTTIYKRDPDITGT